MPSNTETFNRLAARAIWDTLRSCEAVDAGHGRVNLRRVLPHTADELALAAVMGNRHPAPEAPCQVHPAVRRLAQQMKAAAR